MEMQITVYPTIGVILIETNLGCVQGFFHFDQTKTLFGQIFSIAVYNRWLYAQQNIGEFNVSTQFMVMAWDIAKQKILKMEYIISE